ncbi:hypothetical protein JZ751_022320 [Albula glossodonta]|uniref:Wolframin n=1 Tax=Albula glossodonta TaxID=121402 RepID=A0A8T2MT26_9TELE|nr:hypothetical protein JZ751_022320 [Albula glossodonta]
MDTQPPIPNPSTPPTSSSATPMPSITPPTSSSAPPTSSTAPPMPPSASPAPHSGPPGATPSMPTLPLAAAATPSAPPQPRPSKLRSTGSFAALARCVVMQEKMKASGELPTALPTDTNSAPKTEPSEEEEEEELPFEELDKRAKAGDAKAQTNLGRYYLKLPNEGKVEENNCKAVDWLIQAARQGNKDAARLLRHCLTYKKGITPENEEEMRKLASETKFERAVRKAAMMMYWKLNPDRKKKVAVSEMLHNVEQVNTATGGAVAGSVPCAVQDQKRVLESLVTSKNDKYVGLEDFVEITKQFTQGIAPSSPLPSSGHTGTEEDDEDEDLIRKSSNSINEKDEQGHLISTEGGQPAESAYRRMLKSGWGMGRNAILTADSSSMMNRALDIKAHFLVLQYPLHALVEVKEHLIDWASRAGLQWLSTIIPTHHVNALIFFFILSNLTIDFFAFFIPLLIFYLSFISMVICTLRVFQNSKAWENFRALTTLLTRFEPGLDLEQAETNFGWNNLEPYLSFLLSVFFVIFSFPVADKAWIPCSELAMLGMAFTVASYASLSRTAGVYMRRALVIEVASSACALTTRLPERMAPVRMLGATFATVPLGDWVELRLSAPCLLYMYLFYLFFRMAQLRGFRGTYCFLVPYMVCFTWCEFSAVLLQSATAVGLIRTCVACFLFLFALPVLALGLAAMLLVQMAKWFLELQLTKLLVTLAVCAVPVALRWWTRFSLSLLDVLRALVRSSAVKLILMWVSVVLLFCWVYVLRSEGLKAHDSLLSWREYGDTCGPPAWRESSVAQTQILCGHLEGLRVTWTGRFQGVAVAETENGPQAVINLLPAFAGDWLRCLYGEAYPECTGNQTAHGVATQNSSSALEQLEQQELCRLKALAQNRCHVKRFDSHRLEVTVGMLPEEASGLPQEDRRDLVLRASSEFRQALLLMEVGSVVEFTAVLEGRLGSRSPILELQAIHCQSCGSEHAPAGKHYKIEPDWRGTALRAIKFAFDFFFSPFLSARISV